MVRVMLLWLIKVSLVSLTALQTLGDFCNEIENDSMSNRGTAGNTLTEQCAEVISVPATP